MTKKNKKKAEDHSVETCEQIWDFSTQCLVPISHHIINAWAADLSRAVVDQEILTLEDWLCAKKIVRSTFYRLCERNQALKEAHAFALQVIGNRRWKGCAKFELAPAAIMPTMAHYDDRYIKDEERRAALRAQAAQSLESTRQVVVIEKFFPAPEKESLT